MPFPFVAGWANFFLDAFDGDWLIPLGLPNEIYQPVDKITDWVTYVAIVVVAFWNEWPTKRLMLGLSWSAGRPGRPLVTGNELLLALFPNFLEPLFLVTVTILAFERVIRHDPDWQERGFAILYRYRWLIGTVIAIDKLEDEWITTSATSTAPSSSSTLRRRGGGGGGGGKGGGGKRGGGEREGEGGRGGGEGGRAVGGGGR